ncbi:cytochrome c3 family protein [Ferrimonas balearica]|uniref:cytochrome c3 family protein n=1 Tax=Ferrimonas balearica TaxID=44012 RepID=UPI001C99C13F|nr:cytochrome c3 family protein [Ferrimonas balearica]MBY5992318.1 cytochrome c3 family protein [Ferrimonas balearica]
MRQLLKIALATLTLGLFATSAQGMEIRDWHKGMDMNCASCHEGAPKGYPEDDACQVCHDVDDLAEQTARPEEDKWQNPHNNLHYGKDIPCVECHSEHGTKEPMCAQCHTFKYPAHKQ